MLWALTVLVGSLHIHYEDVGELTEPQRIALLGALAKEMGASAPDEVGVDPDRRVCSDRLTCAGEIRSRLDADRVLLLRVFRGPTRYNVVVWRSLTEAVVEIRLPFEESEWPATLAGAVPGLFEGWPAYPRRAAPDLTVRAPAPTQSAPAVWPWAVVGAGVAAGVVGTIVGLRRNADASRLVSEPLAPTQALELQASVRTQARLANVLLASATVMVVSGMLGLAWP